MYLVARPPKEAQNLVKQLQINGISADVLPIMDVIEKDINHADIVRKINITNDVVFFVSPTAINLSQNILNDLDSNTAIILAGKASYEQLNKIKKFCNVKFPQIISGVNGIINEGLLNKVHKIFIFGGDFINSTLQEFCVRNSIEIEFVDLYQRLNMIELHPEIILSKILDTRTRGIIVTSRIIAQWMSMLLRDTTILKKIRSLQFISIHANITSILQQYNLQVVETESTDNESIVHLIRKIENV